MHALMQFKILQLYVIGVLCNFSRIQKHRIGQQPVPEEGQPPPGPREGQPPPGPGEGQPLPRNDEIPQDNLRQVVRHIGAGDVQGNEQEPLIGERRGWCMIQ